MFRLLEKIQVGSFIFNKIIESNISTSYLSTTDTAQIMFANVLYREKNQPIFLGETGLTKLIKRGDVVKIWHGYDKPYENLTLKFNGFVNRVAVGDIITIHAEDYGFVLKNINVATQRIKDATLKTLVDTLIGNAKIEVNYIDPDAKVGTWQIDNNNYVNVVQVLDKLRSDFGISSYFRDTVLTIGRMNDTTGNTYNFIFEHNIIQDNLTYRADDDLNLVIKGVSNLENNTKIERYAYLQAGEIKISETAFPGEQKTLNYYNLTASTLEQTLRDNFNKFIYVGYSGNFTTFLEPNINHGDYLNMYSLKYPERNGKYRVKSVVKNVSTNGGGRQTIELDYKIYDLADIRTGQNILL